MAKELDGILDSSEAEPAKSCITNDGSTSFLEKIITPIYETIAAVGSSIKGSIFNLLLPYRLVLFSLLGSKTLIKRIISPIIFTSIW